MTANGEDGGTPLRYFNLVDRVISWSRSDVEQFETLLLFNDKPFIVSNHCLYRQFYINAGNNETTYASKSFRRHYISVSRFRAEIKFIVHDGEC